MFVQSWLSQGHFVSIVFDFEAMNDLDQSNPQFLFRKSSANAHSRSKPKWQNHERIHHVVAVAVAAVAASSASPFIRPQPTLWSIRERILEILGRSGDIFMLDEELGARGDAVSLDDDVDRKRSSILRRQRQKSLRLFDAGFEVMEIAQSSWRDCSPRRSNVKHQLFVQTVLGYRSEINCARI